MRKYKSEDIKFAREQAIASEYLKKRNWSQREFDTYLHYIDKHITKIKKEKEKSFSKKQTAELKYRWYQSWSQEKFENYMRAIDECIKSNNKERLMELRNFFNLSTDFWCFTGNVNCYAYAIGSDLPPQCLNIRGYFPGCFFESVNQEKLKFNKDNLIERLEMDFETLEFEYRVVSPDEEIGEDEWKIAFFKDLGLSKGNFHFLRQGKDGLWYQKIGLRRDSLPTNKDSNGNFITNPCEVYFNTPPTVQYEYNRCYSLRMR